MNNSLTPERIADLLTVLSRGHDAAGFTKFQFWLRVTVNSHRAKKIDDATYGVLFDFVHEHFAGKEEIALCGK